MEAEIIELLTSIKSILWSMLLFIGALLGVTFGKH